MVSFLLRPRVLALLGVAAAALIALGVAAARSASSGCGVSAPTVELPEQLKVLGDLNQPFDGADPRALQDASLRAATALHSDLAGAVPGDAVAIAANGGDPHDALVIPLAEQGGTPDAPQRVVGLVAFLRDCSGRAWYHDVDDLLRTDPSLLPQHFPLVSRADAAARLGVDSPRLVWRDTPFHPLWLDPRSGRTVVAGPPT